MKIELIVTTDKYNQVLVTEETDTGTDRERLEKSKNVNRAISRAIPFIDGKIREALRRGKTITIDIE